MTNAFSAVTELKRRLLERVSKEALSGNVSAVARLSSAADQCERIEIAVASMEQLLAGEQLSDGPNVLQPHTTKPDFPSLPQRLVHSAYEARESSRSGGREDGSRARAAFVDKLARQGIILRPGRNTAYFTPSGRRIVVPFANELPQLPNKWWLGANDEPADAIVLLCRSSGRDAAVILAKDGLRLAWPKLTRSKGQVKFHVSKAGSSFFLDFPGGGQADLSSMVDKHDVLRSL